MPDLNLILTYFSPELILTLGALVILLYDVVVGGRDRVQPWLALGTLVLALVATFWLYTMPAQSMIFEARNAAGEIVRPGAFATDGFTQFFRLVSLLTTGLVVLSGMWYMRGRTPFKGEFYALLMFSALAMNLMAGSNDLIMIALSIEFLSITSYVLTGYLRGDTLSIEGGLKYFVFGSVVSAAMLMGLTYLYGATGTTSLPLMAEVLADPDNILVAGLAGLALPAIVLVMAGIGFKIALVPFHLWSPDAYEGAPTPVTSFLSVGPKAAGFAVLLRLMLTAFTEEAILGSWLGTLAGIALVTMILGNVAALTQTNVKRMMAYSSIAQAGYMLVGVVGFGGATLMGLTPIGSVLLFILAYLFTNLGAFAVVIAVDQAMGSSELEAYSGLMRRAPAMALALFVFFLSLVGIPPLAGYIGKFAVFGSAIAAGQTPLALVGVLTGVVSVGYYFRVVKHMFFGEVPDDAPPFQVAPTLTFVVFFALAMTFVIGVYADPFVQLANEAAAALPGLAEAMAVR